MGREIKRVPACFDWPMNQVWKGFINPYRSIPCSTCQDQHGHSDGYCDEARKIAKSFHSSNRGRIEGWGSQLTQVETDLLAEKGFIPHLGSAPTADAVNEWQRISPMGHTGSARWLLINHRFKLAGLIYGKEHCPICKGDGELWFSELIQKQHANFHEGGKSIGEVYTDVPEGEWWQVWETVSEGSPVSPAFATGEELATYLAEGGDAWCRRRRSEGRNDAWNQPPTLAQALEFVLGAGFAPSMVVDSAGIHTSYEIPSLVTPTK